MFIKQREAALLRYLMTNKKPVSLPELSERYNVSERTIRYDIDDLNYFLKELSAHIEIKKRDVLLILDADQEKLVKEKLESLGIYEVCFSEQEKINYIILRLLTASRPVTIKNLAEELGVSRGSLNSAMKEVYTWLDGQKIQVIKKQNHGIELRYTENQWRKSVISISGQESNRGYFYNVLLRNCSHSQNTYLNAANYVLPYYSKFIFDEGDLNRMVDAVGQIETLMDTRLPDASFVALMLHLTIAIKRIKENKKIEMPQKQLEELKLQKEYRQAQLFTQYLEKEFQVLIPECEIGYITLHLMGTRWKRKEGSYEIDRARRIAIDLIMKIESFTGMKVGVGYINELIDNLVVHLQPALTRIQHDMRITNPVLEEIQKSYSQLFDMVERACRELEEEYGLESFPRDEIAYIVMHIGAALEKSIPRDTDEIRAVIMCASGIGTAKMLSERLQREFARLRVIGEISLMDLNRLDELKADILITTLDLVIDCRLPVVKVSPLLNRDDIGKIENILQIKGISKGNYFKKYVEPTQEMLEEITAIAEKYGPLENQSAFKMELYQYLTKKMINNRVKEELPMLSDLMNPERISLGYKAADWEEAVREAGRLLVETGCARPQYVDAMVQTVRELGPYIVLSKGMALPHARPEAGAEKVAMSLVILDKPVNFGNKMNDPVKAVFGLCAVDNNTHIQALADLGKFATAEENFDMLLSFPNADKTYQFIKKVCEAD